MGIIAMAQVGLLAGMGGSFHCVGMCGGLAVAASKNLKDAFYYQSGRLLGYLGLAFVVGMTGQRIQSFLSPGAQIAVAMLMGLFLVVMGIRTLFNKTFHLPLPMAKAMNIISRKLPRGSFFVGLGSIFLPCGLLYSMLAALMVLQNPWSSMAFMSLFWLGSLPALTILPHTLRKTIERLGMRWGTLNGILFIAFGLTSMTMKLWHVFEVSGPSCH